MLQVDNNEIRKMIAE